jgi:hypothetical protein
MLCQAYLKVVFLLAALPLIVAQPIKQDKVVSGEMDKRTFSSVDCDGDCVCQATKACVSLEK